MRKPLLGQHGYGKFRCGNCQWFRASRDWGRSGEGPCYLIFGVTPDQKPCPALQKGVVGKFTPIDTGSKVPSITDHVASMDEDDLKVLQALIRDREKEAYLERLTSFRVGDRVSFTVSGQQFSGEVSALSTHYITVKVGEAKWRLTPYTLTKL